MALQPSAAGSLVDLTYSGTQLLVERGEGWCQERKTHTHSYLYRYYTVSHGALQRIFNNSSRQRNGCGEAAEGSEHPVLHPHVLINGRDFTYFTSSGALLLASTDLVHGELSSRGASGSSSRGPHRFPIFGFIRMSGFHVWNSKEVFLTSALDNVHH